MTSARQLLRALADRPGELDLLLRSEYRPRQTLLHHAAATGDAELLSALLAYDPSLAQVEVEEGRDGYSSPALVAAVAALQPAAVRALLPLSWPLPARRAGEAPDGQHGQQAGGSSSSTDDSWSSCTPGAIQVGLLPRLLHTIAVYDECHSLSGWPDWAAPPQPAPAGWRQRAEATLAALLEGPHGGLARAHARHTLCWLYACTA